MSPVSGFYLRRIVVYFHVLSDQPGNTDKKRDENQSNAYSYGYQRETGKRIVRQV